MASPSDRRGISLLEVLIAMFVLAVGILSVLALFTAGRELEARAAVKSSALAFAASQKQTSGTQWLDWRQWLVVADPTTPNFRWAKPNPEPAVAPPIVLPVLVDPWGLCADAVIGTSQNWDSGVSWDWSRFTPLTSWTITAAPFQRVTVPMTERAAPYNATNPIISPFSREGALASFSDEDSIEYAVAANADDPPLNAFEVGRRKRGSDLVPALFIAALIPGNFTVEAGTRVKRSLLVFYRPVPDFESAGATNWPSGVVELRAVRHEPGLLIARLTTTPTDLTVVRRSLRPGKWMLFTNRLPHGLSGPYFYDCEWREVTSVTQDTDGWLIVLKSDLPEGWPPTPDNIPTPPVKEWSTAYPDLAPPNPRQLSPISCYAFEHLVHVEPLDNAVLP